MSSSVRNIEERKTQVDGARDSSVISAGFFVLRFPMLPFDQAPNRVEGPVSFPAHASAPQSEVRPDVAGLLARSDIFEALYIASPTLTQRLSRYASLSGKERRRVDESILKYLTRMSSRCTPFGLFAELAVGVVGESTNLVLDSGSRRRRVSRLDMDYLSAVAEFAVSDPIIAGGLSYRANETWYRIGASIRYVDYVSRAGAGRSYQLAVLEADEPLLAVLGAAEAEASFRSLSTIAERWAETSEEAEEYVRGLIAARILLPSIEPAVVGCSNPAEYMAMQLAAVDGGQGLASTLNAMNATLATIDAEPHDGSLAKYDSLRKLAESIPVKTKAGQLFQVDSFRDDPRISLSAKVVDDVVRASALLYRLSWYTGSGEYREAELDRFRRAFVEQYEGEEVNLSVALDSESGVGYDGAFGDESDPEPFLAGFRDGRETVAQSEWGPRETYLVGLIDSAVRRGEAEVILGDADIERLSNPTPPPPLRSGYARIELASPNGSPEDGYWIKLSALGIGSALPLFGRFCFGSPELDSHVARQWDIEAMEHSDALIAEIVHLPQSRHGNVIVRPTFGTAEIVLLGRSASSHTQKIPLRDLTVRVVGERIVLRSKALQRDVIPKLSSAHSAFAMINVPAYRFLHALCFQDRPVGVRWNWGALDNLPFRPRIRVDNVVFASAKWSLMGFELDRLRSSAGERRMAVVRQIREDRRIPRYVYLQDEEPFLIDLESSTSVDLLVGMTGATRVELAECFASPDTSVLKDAGGSTYAHELFVPLRPAVAAPADAARSIVRSVSTNASRKRFPGGDLTYAKIYCGSATADSLLVNVLGPFAQARTASGQLRSWFFIRYRDPDPHIRLRLFSPDAGAAAQVRLELARIVERLYDESRVRRLVHDTYVREAERYGGAESIDDAERMFHADSVCALSSLALSTTTEETRWLVAAYSMARLAQDLGFEDPAQLAALFVQHSRALFRGIAPSAVKSRRRFLATSFRAHRRELRSVADNAAKSNLALAAIKPFVDARAIIIRECAERLWERHRNGVLTSSIESIVISHVHMCANRMFRSRAVAQEQIICDHLGQSLKERLRANGIGGEDSRGE